MWNPLTLALALLAGCGRPCLSILHASDARKRFETLGPAASGYPESAQHCSGPSRHPSGRLPRSAPRRCHGLVSGHLGPGQNFAAAELAPIRCNFSSARKVVAVKRASLHICRQPLVQHQDLASPLTHDDFEVCRRCDTERDTERPRWGAGAVDELLAPDDVPAYAESCWTK